jgi:hypothetical protein
MCEGKEFDFGDVRMAASRPADQLTVPNEIIL